MNECADNIAQWIRDTERGPSVETQDEIVDYMRACQDEFDVDDVRDDDPGCPLTAMAAWRGMPEVLAVLAEQGADFSKECNGGSTSVVQAFDAFEDGYLGLEDMLSLME